MSIRILRMISKNHWSSLTFYARRHLRNSWPATTERWPHPHSRRPPSFCSTHVVSSNTSLVSKGEPNAKQSKKTPRICWLWWTRSGKNFYPTLALFIGQIGKNSYLSKRSPRTKGFSWRRKGSTFPCWQLLWYSPNAPVIVVCPCPPLMCSKRIQKRHQRNRQWRQKQKKKPKLSTRKRTNKMYTRIWRENMLVRRLHIWSDVAFRLWTVLENLQAG